MSRQGKRWVIRRLPSLLILVALAGCAHEPPPAVDVQPVGKADPRAVHAMQH